MYSARINFRLSMLISMVILATANLNKVIGQDNTPSAPLPSNGAAVDEVVVESSLHIKQKPKPSLRRTIRSLSKFYQIQFLDDTPSLASLIEHKRVKRQNEYGQSQAAANAAANNHYQNPFGFGSSAGNAGSQAFNAYGPSSSFGAASSGSITQAHNANKFGVQNSAGASMSQVFHLPNGQTINFALTNSFANGPGGNNANSRGGAVSVSRG